MAQWTVVEPIDALGPGDSGVPVITEYQLMSRQGDRVHIGRQPRLPDGRGEQHITVEGDYGVDVLPRSATGSNVWMHDEGRVRTHWKWTLSADEPR